MDNHKKKRRSIRLWIGFSGTIAMLSLVLACTGFFTQSVHAAPAYQAAVQAKLSEHCCSGEEAGGSFSSSSEEGARGSSINHSSSNEENNGNNGGDRTVIPFFSNSSSGGSGSFNGQQYLNLIAILVLIFIAVWLVRRIRSNSRQ